MKSFRNSIVVTLVAACGVLTAVVAAPPTASKDSSGNSYYLFTKALHVDDTGVVAIPSRFKWSVETSAAGHALQAKPVADSRVIDQIGSGLIVSLCCGQSSRLAPRDEPYSETANPQLRLKQL